MTAVVTPQRLREFFHPRSFALIGASDKSTFSALLYRNETIEESGVAAATLRSAVLVAQLRRAVEGASSAVLLAEARAQADRKSASA